MKEYSMTATILAVGNELNQTAVNALSNYTPALNETAQNLSTYALQTSSAACSNGGSNSGYGALVALIGLGAVAFLVVRRH